MSNYLEVQDITANIAKGFALQPYLDEADKEVIDLAERLGVMDSDDIVDPLHHKVRRYAISFVLMRLCQDKIGTNNVEISDLDKYTLLYNMYSKELNKLKTEISKEMIIGQVYRIRDRSVMSGLLIRG